MWMLPVFFGHQDWFIYLFIYPPLLISGLLSSWVENSWWWITCTTRTSSSATTLCCVCRSSWYTTGMTVFTFLRMKNEKNQFLTVNLFIAVLAGYFTYWNQIVDFFFFSLHTLCSSVASQGRLSLCRNITVCTPSFPFISPALARKLKGFSTQLATPAVTLRVLPRCFFERFSSLSRCCHDNSSRGTCASLRLKQMLVSWNRFIIFLAKITIALLGGLSFHTCILIFVF